MLSKSMVRTPTTGSLCSDFGDGCKPKLRKSPRLELLRVKNKCPKKKKQYQKKRRAIFNWANATTEDVAKRVVWDYNKKHGTKLEFVGLLAGKDNYFFGFGYASELMYVAGFWKHFNFEVRRVDADPSDKPLVMFAELVKWHKKFHLITLSLVTPTHQSKGCVSCPPRISHLRHGFRAGLNLPSSSYIPSRPPSTLVSAAEFSEFALQSYNKKHGTSIKFERALKCNSFACPALSMDFDEKNTNWVHLNFEARVGSREKIVCLFAELYLGDDGEYVLATLSPAQPSGDAEEWKKKYAGVNGCVFCPADILHPWRAYRHSFNHSPMECLQQQQL